MSVYYPPVGFHFKVEFQGAGSTDADNRFQEVSGLAAEVTTEELVVGGENRFAYRLPTGAKYSNLVLKRGMLKDSGLISWITNALGNFQFSPVNINVYLLDENHDVLVTWVFMQAYPVKWAISDFRAQDSSIVVETLELAYQYFRRQ
jgi:phage tail-like protein